jgi:hypothetical protein
MDRIDALLEKATPNLGRREHLRNVYREWERVETLAGSRTVQVPLIVGEGPEISGAGIVISAADPEELEQIREELATAGVPLVRLVPEGGT